MSFDTPIDRRGTHSVKWDMMEKLYGVPMDDGIAMWVADMEFQPPACVQDAVKAMHDHGVYGYYGDEGAYLSAIQWWMAERHGWNIDPSWVFTTHGLVNGTAMCVDAFTSPGDGIVLFTPVYHAFAKVIKAADRRVVECELTNTNGRYEFDFDSYDAQMTGSERMVILCSPHNPGGRVWTKAELHAVAAFAKRHELILVSDEIHHDLTMPGHTHTPMAHIDGLVDRLVTMTATTKTFNIAGSHSGNVIIEDPDLRARFGARMAALGMSPNSFGLFMATAAYSPDGAAWVDDLKAYLDGNRKIFDAGINAMTRDQFTDRVQKDARIAVNHGPTFGTGGESFLRFNIAAPRAQVIEAVERMQKAFAGALRRRKSRPDRAIYAHHRRPMTGDHPKIR